MMREPDILAQLQAVLADQALADSARNIGERLLGRLSSAIRIVLFGPEGENKERFFEMLTARPIDDTVISAASLEGDLAFGQADIGIWCTVHFDAAEATSWENAPDRLKDHSFLVPLATPDKAQSQFADARLDALGAIADEEFHSMFPVIFGPQNAAASSGGFDPLIAEITKLVRSGRRADRDNALLFLQSHQPMTSAGSGVQAQANEDSFTATSAGPVDPGAPVAVYEEALNHIRERATDLAPPESSEDDAGIARVLSVCQETSETVAEIFSDNRSRDPDFLLLKEDVLGAADKLLLMSVEGGVAPAIAAVTTLLQTRREMEARIAF